MKFALVTGLKEEAEPKQPGKCLHCGADMVAKCGRVKVWHWAHKGQRNCDPWWENETEWHRAWKNKFPMDWQEISHTDAVTGHKHIADVKIPHGLVIEFQHSPIHPDEMKAREEFYGEMIWIVDGLRGDLDKNYFNMGPSGPIQKDPLAYSVAWWGRSRLLHNWSEANAKVVLDFGEDRLWRLVLFDTKQNAGAVGPLPKGSLIEGCLNGTDISVTMLDDVTRV